jgi:hypothetical protein
MMTTAWRDRIRLTGGLRVAAMRAGERAREVQPAGRARRSNEMKIMPHFDKSQTVEQAFKTHAGARRVFARFHLGGCSNCSISETETIEQVSEGYGIPSRC